jgi:superfamily II DNA or RNA helicase
MVTLREYQKEARDAVCTAWAEGTHSVIVVLPTGMGKCLGWQEDVFLGNGSIVPAYTLVGKTVDVIGVTDTETMQKVSVSATFTDNGIRDVYRVTFDNGTSIIRTAEHPLWTARMKKYHVNAQTGKDCTVPIDAGWVQTKDILPTGNRRAYYDMGHVVLSPVGLPMKGYEVDPDIVFLAALFFAEGALSNGDARFSTSDPETLERARVIAARYGCRVQHIANYDYALRLENGTRNPITKILKEWGMWGKRAEQKTIPSEIMQGDDQTIALFLRHLWDMDGWYSFQRDTAKAPQIGIALATKEGVEQVSKLAHRLGIVGGRIRYQKNEKRGAYRWVSSEVEKWQQIIGANVKAQNLADCVTHNQARIEGRKSEWLAWRTARTDGKFADCPEGYRWLKVVSVEALPPQSTVSIEVHNDNHAFLGYAVEHNTHLLLSVLAAERDGGQLGRAIILAHRKELIDQPARRIEEFFLGQLPIPGIVMGGRNDAGAEVICATVQTLSRERRLREVLRHGPVTHLIIDEAHHAAASGYVEVIEHLRSVNPHLRILGVTATPNRSDAAALTVFDKQVYKKTIKDAIHNYKVLVPFVAMGIKLPVDISRVKIQQGDYSAGELGSVMDVANANDIIVETWKKHASDRLTMAFTATVAHAKHLAEAFQDHGVRAEWASADTAKEDRDAMLKRFERGETRVIVNCALFTEGLDVPNISCVLMARPTQSNTVYTQAVGRGLRTFPGKENCLILDFVPTSNKSLLTGNALLEGKPLEQRKAEDAAMKQGTILEVIGMDIQGNGIDADPDTVVMQALNLLGSAPLAWTFDGKLATAGGGQNLTLVIVSPQEDRVAKAQQLKAAGQWKPEWDASFERISAYSVYAVNGSVSHIGSVAEWSGAVEVAQDYVEEYGDPMLARKSKSWRGDAATAGQRGMMKRLGVPYKPGMSKGEASQAIAHKMAEIELKKVGILA